ncbi:hypothetical protein [Algoriphagus litoralis]|nr:hypothetical protein [Algoriphagus litoralis]
MTKPSNGFKSLGGYAPVEDSEAVNCAYQGFEEVQGLVANGLYEK